MSEFYVYHHLRGDDRQVFYVAAKHGFDVSIIADGLSEADAFALERREIARIGRENLCNNSNGGEGPCGAVHSQEANARKSKSVKTMWDQSPERKLAMASARKAMWADPSIRGRIVAAQTASHKNPENKAAKSRAMRLANARPVLCIDTGITYDTIAYAVDWLKSLGKEKAVSCTISYAASGKRPSAYGYRWQYA